MIILAINLVIVIWLVVLALLAIDTLIGLLQKWNKFPSSIYRISQRNGKFYAEYFLCGHKPELGVYRGFGWHPVRYYPNNDLAQVYAKGSDVGYDKYNFAKEAITSVKAKIDSNRNIKFYIN